METLAPIAFKSFLSHTTANENNSLDWLIESHPVFSQKAQLFWHVQKLHYIPWDMLCDDVIKCKRFPRYWPFVRGIHRSPADSPHKGQWCVALMFSLICASTNGWANNRDAGDLKRHCAHYDVTIMNVPIFVGDASLAQGQSGWANYLDQALWLRYDT